MQNAVKKTKINLEDYAYQEDIEYRILMSDLSMLEVDTINEILYSSLSIPVNRLLEDLGVNAEQMEPVFEKLTQMKLLKVHGEMIEVNKEMRKYYESQISKFDDGFRPDTRYLKGLLNKPPIHVLPLWYLLPRTSDDIFQSIIDKFLLTPEIYSRHLEDLQFDDPILQKVVDEVYSSPDNKVYGNDLIEKFSLERDQFEEYMLLLEFHLACCLSYNEVDGKWVEVITPFYEWNQYLKFQKQTTPKQIEDQENIHRTLEHDFGFVQDMTRLLLAAQDEKIILEKNRLTEAQIAKFFPETNPCKVSEDYFDRLIERALNMKFAKISGDELVTLDNSNDWIKKPLEEQAMMVYRFPSKGGMDKDTRFIAKSFKNVLKSGWIYFDDFFEGFTAPIGEHHPVMLNKTGKRWEYQLPKYSQSERELVKNTIFQLLLESGMVATGNYEGKLCFKITNYGKITLD